MIPHGQKTFGPKPYILPYKCRILNQNRLLFKENPISNGFNLEKQQKANKSLEACPRKAWWLLHFWCPGPEQGFGIAAAAVSCSEYALPWDVGDATPP